MTPQELAHWAYQLGRLDELKIHEKDPNSGYCVPFVGDVVGDAFAEMVNIAKWLREEASYMVELGKAGGSR